MLRLPVPDAWLAYSVRRRLLDQALEKARPWLHGGVLEIGSGRRGRRGLFQPPHEQTDFWFHADLSPARAPHLLADVTRLPFANDALDVILCLEVLEYVDDPRLAISEMFRVLKPGGLLALSTPFMHRRDSVADLWRFTDRGLTAMLARTGFSPPLIDAQGGALASAAHVLQSYLRQLPSSSWRSIVSMLFRPVLRLLLRFDSRSVDLGYTTGYLLLTTKPARI